MIKKLKRQLEKRGGELLKVGGAIAENFTTVQIIPTLETPCASQFGLFMLQLRRTVGDLHLTGLVLTHFTFRCRSTMALLYVFSSFQGSG